MPQSRLALRASLVASLAWLACGEPAPSDADAGAGTDTSALWTECTPSVPCATCAETGSGKAVGDVIRDIEWLSDSGATTSLHASCGVRRAVLIIETASWCTICSERISLFRQWFDQFHPRGVDFIFNVGENLNGQPATVADVQKYRADHALGPEFAVVADPKWSKITGAIAHPPGVGVLPLFAVLDSEMVLRYLGDGAEKTRFHQASDAIGTLVDHAFVPASGCDGSCGTIAPAGCWCDAFCAQLGNCCEDNCATCGNCQ